MAKSVGFRKKPHTLWNLILIYFTALIFSTHALWASLS